MIPILVSPCNKEFPFFSSQGEGDLANLITALKRFFVMIGIPIHSIEPSNDGTIRVVIDLYDDELPTELKPLICALPSYLRLQPEIL